MPLYRCLIRGENFVWPEGDRWQLMGFYTTRWVRAPNPQAAELTAVEALRREPSFQKPDNYTEGRAAVVIVEEIEKVRIPPLKRGRGATWFAMEGADTTSR